MGYALRLQHPEGIHFALSVAFEGWYADLCEDLDWQDYHIGCRGQRHHRQCQGQDPGQGGHSTRSAALDLCRQAAGRWPHLVRLQHPEGVHVAPRVAFAWWHVMTRPASQSWLVAGLVADQQSLSSNFFAFERESVFVQIRYLHFPLPSSLGPYRRYRCCAFQLENLY